jgi:hypothetical protein
MFSPEMWNVFGWVTYAASWAYFIRVGFVIITRTIVLIVGDLPNWEYEPDFVFSFSEGDSVEDYITDDDDSQDFTNIDISLEFLNGFLALVAQPYIQEATESMYFNSI